MCVVEGEDDLVAYTHLDWTWEGPVPKDGLTSFWRFMVLGSLLWIDFSSPFLFLRLVSSIFPSCQF